jgi:DNA-binding NarL/FixJ family response regulator
MVRHSMHVLPRANGATVAMLNVLIADPHPVARSGLHLLVERLVAHSGDECLVAFSDDALTAFRKAKRLQPDLILLSVDLPMSGGLQAVLALRRYTPNARLVVVSGEDEVRLPSSFLDAGAHGVLRKGQTLDELEAALKSVLRGETYTPDDASR